MIPGVDSWAVAVALSLDSVWSSWPWIPFGLALDDSGVNGCGGGSLVCRKNHQQNERTTRQRKSNEQTIVCMGLAIACSFRGFCLAVALDDSRRGLCSRFGVVALRSLPDDLRGLALHGLGVVFGVRPR